VAQIVMLLENDLYPQDTRVRYEAESLVRNGYEVRVIAPRGPKQVPRDRIDGVDVERFRLVMDHTGQPRDLIREYLAAHLQLWTRGIHAVLRGADVLHAHNPPDTLFIPAIVGRPRGCRFVFDQHDLFPELFEEKFGSGAGLSVARAMQRVTLRLADLTLATNESQRDAAIRAGARPDQVVVMRNSLSREMFAAGRPLRRGELTEPHLVYVGALESQDGVAHLADVMLALRADHGLAGARLTVIGFGAERAPLEHRLADLGVADRVTFTGRVDHNRVLEIVADADICVDTAECTELNHRTTMVKIVEYLSLGRPTVAFALRETERTTGDAAALAPCGQWDQFISSIAELARSEDRRNELARRARERAELLAWEHSEAALLGAYERMLTAA
jgi:glycosyltransferase involved in cell wall biosynthesis